MLQITTKNSKKSIPKQKNCVVDGGMDGTIIFFLFFNCIIRPYESNVLNDAQYDIKLFQIVVKAVKPVESNVLSKVQ